MATKRKTQTGRYPKPDKSKTWWEWYAGLIRESEDTKQMFLRGSASLFFIFGMQAFPFISYNLAIFLIVLLTFFDNMYYAHEDDKDPVEFILIWAPLFFFMGHEYTTQFVEGEYRTLVAISLVQQIGMIYSANFIWELVGRADFYYFDAQTNYRKQWGTAGLISAYLFLTLVPIFRPLKLIAWELIIKLLIVKFLWGVLTGDIQWSRLKFWQSDGWKFWQKFDFAKLKPKSIPKPNISIPRPKFSRDGSYSAKADELLKNVMSGEKEPSELSSLVGFNVIYNQIFKVFDLPTENDFRVGESTAKESLEIVASNPKAWNSLVKLVADKLKEKDKPKDVSEQPGRIARARAGITSKLPSIRNRQPKGESGDDTKGKSDWLRRKGGRKKSPEEAKQQGRTEVPS